MDGNLHANRADRPERSAPGADGGFSCVPPERLVRPLLSGGDFGFERINVGAQRSDRDSLLNWMSTLIRTRRECSEIGSGRATILATDNDAVLGLRYDADGGAIVVLNNLSRRRQTAMLDLHEQEAAMAIELFCDRPYGPLDPERLTVRMNGSGYRWLRLGASC